MSLLLYLAAAAAPPGDLDPRGLERPAVPAPRPEERAAMALVQEGMAEVDSSRRMRAFDRALQQVPQPTRFRGAVQCMRAVELLSQSKAEDGRAAAEECYGLQPDHPSAQWLMANLRIDEGNYGSGVPLMIKGLKADPRLASGFSTAYMETLFRGLTYSRLDAEREQLLLALAEANYGRDEPEFFSRLVKDLILSRIGSNDFDAVGRLTPLVLSPEIGLQMLVDRRFDRGWPEIERWANGTLEDQRQAYIRTARAAHEAQPTPEHLLALAEALSNTGDRFEAITLLRDFVQDGGHGDETLYFSAMATVRLARYLRMEGRADEGLKAMRDLLAATPPKDNPAAINIIPNLASWLAFAGRPGEALELIERHTPTVDAVEHPMALGYFVSLRACALHQLGRATEAEQALATLRGDYASNGSARRMASYCTGAARDWVETWRDTLDDPSARGSALLKMARARRANRSASSSPEADAFDERSIKVIAQDRDAAALFLAEARDLPESFGPALDTWSAGR